MICKAADTRLYMSLFLLDILTCCSADFTCPVRSCFTWKTENRKCGVCFQLLYYIHTPLSCHQCYRSGADGRSHSRWDIYRRGQDVMYRLSRFTGNVLNNFLYSNVFHHFSTHADVMSGSRCESQLMIM